MRCPVGGTIVWDAYLKLLQREQESPADAKYKRATALSVWRPPKTPAAANQWYAIF